MTALIPEPCAHAPDLFMVLQRSVGGRLDGLVDDDGATSRALQRVWNDGRAAFGELGITAPQLVEHIGRLKEPRAAIAGERAEVASPTMLELAMRIAEMHGADLYLACACTLGVSGAVDLLHRKYLEDLPLQLTRLRLSPAQVDEVRQRLAMKLLVARPGARPRIGDYSGRGSLATWLRLAATRIGVDLYRERSHQPLEDAPPSSVPAGAKSTDVELRYLQQRYAGDFARAVRAALASLPAAQRELLRLHVVEGLNIEAIGASQGIHRATVARHIAAARSAVFESTHERLRAQLGVDSNDFRSLVGVLRSQFDISLAGLLCGDGERRGG